MLVKFLNALVRQNVSKINIKKREQFIAGQDSYLKQIMATRTNIAHYSKQIPEKELIESILKSAIELVPVKNDLYDYEVVVWGPEYDEEKRKLTLSSYNQTDKSFYSDWLKKDPAAAFAELEEIQTKDQAAGYYKFNYQLLAPYLLVYHKRPGAPTKSQLSKNSNWFNIFNYNNNSSQWLVSASMHAFGVSLLCAENGLHASFCNCFARSSINNNITILTPSDNKDTKVAFMLGIGYREDKKYSYYRPNLKPAVEEIVTWK